MRKATKPEVEQRILVIYQLCCKGYSFTEIVQYCKQKYEIKKTQTSKYIKRAYKKILENNKGEIENKRAEAITRYLSWLKKAEEKGNITDAVKIQSRIDKINGLEVENINVSGEITIKDLEKLGNAWFGNKAISKTGDRNSNNNK